MSSATNNDTVAFHFFLTQQIAAGKTDQSPEECLAAWRLQREEQAATIAAAQEGLNDFAAGRFTSRENFDREFRQKVGLPPRNA